MAKKRKSDTLRNTIKYLIAIPAIFTLLTNFIDLFNFEARLAGKSILAIIMLTVIAGMLVSITWLCALAFLAIYLISLQWSSYAILALLIGINLLFIILIGFAIKQKKEYLFFPFIRKQIVEICCILKE